MIDKNEMFATRTAHKEIHCKNCVYNLGNGARGDCTMFPVMKPDKIYFDGEKCPLHNPKK
jgi:hypothetical protein